MLTFRPHNEHEQWLDLTGEHQIWTRHGWKGAGALGPEDQIWAHKGWAVVDSVSDTLRVEDVYDLEADEFHTDFVGPAGVLDHNSCFEDIAPHVAHRFPGESQAQVADYLRRFAQTETGITTQAVPPY